jgi:predicted nuclease with TOPRIM domain
MNAMRDAWTDERLDDLTERMEKDFRRVDERFDKVDQRFERVDERFDQLNARFDSLQQSIIVVGRRTIHCLPRCHDRAHRDAALRRRKPAARLA